jgi:heptosyltransferase-2
LPFEKDDRFAGSVVMCPGAAYGPAKMWPGFGELARRMGDRQVVVLGDKRDVEAAEAVRRAAPRTVTNLAGTTSLVDAARVIAGASLVVSNDSGLMHLAGLLGTPVVGIFGSTRPSWTRPLGENVRIAAVALPCSPCFDRTCRYGHYQCLHRVTVDSVEGHVRELMPAHRADDEGGTP